MLYHFTDCKPNVEGCPNLDEEGVEEESSSSEKRLVFLQTFTASGLLKILPAERNYCIWLYPLQLPFK